MKSIKQLFRLNTVQQAQSDTKLDTIIQMLGTLVIDTTTLTANEEKLVSDLSAFKASNTQALSDLKTAQDALAAAIAANDPIATAAAQAQIDSVAQALATADATIAVDTPVPTPTPDAVV